MVDWLKEGYQNYWFRIVNFKLHILAFYWYSCFHQILCCWQNADLLSGLLTNMSASSHSVLSELKIEQDKFRELELSFQQQYAHLKTDLEETRLSKEALLLQQQQEFETQRRKLKASPTISTWRWFPSLLPLLLRLYFCISFHYSLLYYFTILRHLVPPSGCVWPNCRALNKTTHCF